MQKPGFSLSTAWSDLSTIWDKPVCLEASVYIPDHYANGLNGLKLCTMQRKGTSWVKAETLGLCFCATFQESATTGLHLIVHQYLYSLAVSTQSSMTRFHTVLGAGKVTLACGLLAYVLAVWHHLIQLLLSHILHHHHRADSENVSKAIIENTVCFEVISTCNTVQEVLAWHHYLQTFHAKQIHLSLKYIWDISHPDISDRQVCNICPQKGKVRKAFIKLIKFKSLSFIKQKIYIHISMTWGDASKGWNISFVCKSPSPHCPGIPPSVT